MAQKSLLKNALFNVVYKLANILFPLITTVYISHVLTAFGVGRVGVAQNIAQYFVLIAPLGIINYGTREIAKRRDSKKDTNKLFSELFVINLISTLICSLLYYTLIFSGAYFEEERNLYCVTGLLIIFNIINVDWYYQGQEEYVYISIRSIIVKLLSLIFIFLFVKSPSDYIIYALIYVFGIAGNYLFNVFNLVKEGIKLEFKELHYSIHLKAIFILLCSSIAIELYTLVDTTMLGVFCSDDVVGFYTNSVKLDRIVVGLISSIGMILLPRLSYCIKNGDIDTCNNILSKIVMIMAYLAIPCGIGLLLLADIVVPVFFGESFMPAITTVRIGTILIYILAFSNLFGSQVLLSFNQERKLLLCTIIGAVINILANLILIPKLEQNGAIVASVMSELIVMLLSLKFALYYVKINTERVFWYKTLIGTFVMCFGVLLAKSIINNGVLCIVVSSIVGASIYLGTSWIIKNPIIPIAQNVIKRRTKL